MAALSSLTSRASGGGRHDGRTATSPREWVDRWDRQQELYVPYREQRFGAMFEAIWHLVDRDRDRPQAGFRVLDLGCGPAAIGERLLARFPTAA